jgi:transcriptional regulator with XRE-family HTH domain
MLIENELVSLEALWAFRMRSLRLHRGLTLSDLADAMGVSEREIVAIETGDGAIAASDLWKLSRVLEVSIDELMGDATPAKLARTLCRQLH